MHKGKLLCKLLIVLSHVGLPLSGLKWHERIMRSSRLLLPIVEWEKWSIVLNHTDFSCGDGGNSLILALLQETVDSTILKCKCFNSISYFNIRRFC